MSFKEFKNWLKKHWAIESHRSAIKLGALLLMMALIVIYTNSLSSMVKNDNTIDNNNNNNNNTVIPIKEEETNNTTSSISDLLNILNNNNYEYVYNITINNIKTIFEGKKFNNYELGTKEMSNEIFKYYIDNDLHYKIVLGEKQPIDYLYSGINKNYINSKYITNAIMSSTSIIDATLDIKTNEYTIIDNNDVKVIITYDDKSIHKIDLSYDNTTYSLEYSNIGLVKEDDVYENIH